MIMSTYLASSEHSIAFFPENTHSANKGFNTFKDWHMVPTTRPSVMPKKARTEYITVPGRDGVLDFSEVANDKVLYDNRTGSWEFVVLHELCVDKTWSDIYSELMNNLHGKRMRVALLDAPEYYYVGRITVNNWKSNAHWSTVTIDYDLAPGRTKFSSPTFRPKG